MSWMMDLTLVVRQEACMMSRMCSDNTVQLSYSWMPSSLCCSEGQAEFQICSARYGHGSTSPTDGIVVSMMLAMM